jgi:hypothetical protein
MRGERSTRAICNREEEAASDKTAVRWESQLQNLRDPQRAKEIIANVEHALSDKGAVAGVYFPFARERELGDESSGTKRIRAVVYSYGRRRRTRACRNPQIDSPARANRFVVTCRPRICEVTVNEHPPTDPRSIQKAAIASRSKLGSSLGRAPPSSHEQDQEAEHGGRNHGATESRPWSRRPAFSNERSRNLAAERRRQGPEPVLAGNSPSPVTPFPFTNPPSDLTDNRMPLDILHLGNTVRSVPPPVFATIPLYPRRTKGSVKYRAIDSCIRSVRDCGRWPRNWFARSPAKAHPVLQPQNRSNPGYE